MNAIFSNKVFWGIVLTAIIGALTAVSSISPTWGGAIIAIVSILNVIGHTTGVLKGIRESRNETLDL